MCVSSMFKDLQLSVSAFAGIYSLATVAASLFLQPMGRLIDSKRIEQMVVINSVMMAFGTLVIAMSQSFITLFIGFVIVRLFGQGVFLLTASTNIARHFQKNRGKALSVMTMGFSISELIYPSITLLLLNSVGWRQTYLYFSLSNIIIVLPVLLFFAKRSGFNLKRYFEDEYCDEKVIEKHRDYSFREALGDPSYYLLILASCIPPLLMTGLLFHQDTIFSINSWSLAIIPLGYSVHAVFKLFGTLGVGPLVDRYGPVVFFSILIILLGLGVITISLSGPEFHVYLYFAIVGLALGMSGPVMNVIWPNMYGTIHLGEIKGFVSMFRNGFTALGPLPFALAIDYGVHLPSVLRDTGFVVLFMALIPFGVYYFSPRIQGHLSLLKRN